MRLIDADALVAVPNVCKVTEYDETGCGMSYKAVPVKAIYDAPTIDAKPVQHGRWVHEIHEFYRESMCEDYCLTCFITAKCSECGEKHGENGQVYSEDFIGEEDGERPVENVTEKIDLARRNYLAGLMNGRYKLKNYCSNCGAKMDAKED